MTTVNNSCWIIGRKATIAANNHDYITGPFLVFETEDQAKSACDMVQKVSGERPMMVEAGRWRCWADNRPHP